MRYRIHYKQRQKEMMAELDANSPNEAVVKFQHLRAYDCPSQSSRPQVTSVTVADTTCAWT